MKISLPVVILIASLLCAPLGKASTPDFWKKSGFSYEGNDTDIKTVLEEFSQSFGVELVMADDVFGTLDGWQKGASGDEFLNALGVKYRFQWFVFKNKLYVSSNSDMVVKKIKVDQKAAINLEDALKGVELLEKKFGWGQLPDEGAVLISGPRQYVEFVKELVEQKEDQRNEKDIMIFPLKYATVSDRRIQFRDKTLTIPGATTILQNLLKGKSADNTNASSSFGENGEAMGNTAAMFEDSYVKSNSTIQVEGDVRTNSIIIRDFRKREWYYKNLIKKIDVEKKLIEIEAIIVDIDRSNLKEFGVDWHANDIGGASVTVLNSLSQLNQSMNGAATIEISDVVSFRAMLQALESSGDASIMANTSILTVENQPAVFDLSETRYVQSVGERVAEFESITAGTLLHVVPRNIVGSKDDQVQLVVEIEDGQIVDMRADGLPTVKKISINTSAVVDEGRSLVVGGYNVQTDADHNNKIPLLGDIPLLGKAFSHRKRIASKRERLFILTPRISNYSNVAAIDTSPKNSMSYDYMANSSNKNMTDRLTLAFRSIATGKIPLGYELSKDSPSQLRKTAKSQFIPECAIVGAASNPESIQRIVGEDIEIWVSTIENASAQQLTLDESLCADDNAVAISFWPSATLAPGEKTEFYVAKTRNPANNRSRPSLLGKR